MFLSLQPIFFLFINFVMITTAKFSLMSITYKCRTRKATQYSIKDQVTKGYILFLNFFHLNLLQFQQDTHPPETHASSKFRIKYMCLHQLHKPCLVNKLKQNFGIFDLDMLPMKFFDICSRIPTFLLPKISCLLSVKLVYKARCIDCRFLLTLLFLPHPSLNCT